VQASQAHGAGESGLARVIQMHGIAAAGDALVLLSLANTVFFSVPVGEARGRVALYLLVTMAPFSLLAPVIGPLLDRFRNGRRYALAATLVGRAFLAWVMAGAVAGGKEAFALYPAAFGYLVLSKAYHVTRAAATPRVLPHALSLVTANSRVMLGGAVGIAVASPIGGALLKLFGSEWSLRLAFVVFGVGVVLALRLPAKVDSAEGEVRARLTAEEAEAVPGKLRRLRAIGPRVVVGLRATSALRAFTGFLTLFLAFALRTDPVSDSVGTIGAIGLVVGGAAVGSTIGTSLGALLRRIRPEVVLVAMLAIATVSAAAGSVWYSLAPVVGVGLGAGFAATLGKLALDALIQREVPDNVRSSAFARSETVLQLAWVLGGALGITLPVPGAAGLGIAAGGLAVMLVFTLRGVALSGRKPGLPAGHRRRAARVASDRRAEPPSASG
jgi:MFS family permease